MIQAVPELDFELMGLPLSFDGARPGIRRPPPALGQHTAEIVGDMNADPAATAGPRPAKGARS